MPTEYCVGCNQTRLNHVVTLWAFLLIIASLLGTTDISFCSAQELHPSSSSNTSSWCGTVEDVDTTMAKHIKTLVESGVCPQRGACDNPATRDSTPVQDITLRVIAHIITSRDGSCSLADSDVRDAITHLNDVYRTNGTGVQFNLVAIRTHVDDALAWVPACDSSETCSSARAAIWLTRNLYAESPTTQCNLYFSCLRRNQWGGIAGVGSVPWSSGALTPSGGIWMNSLELGYKPHLAPHEMGHVLGLWHTHHGVSEVSACSDPCAEPVNGPDRDRSGDFASDTPATPKNYYCMPPYGADCNGATWGDGQPENYMGYGPPECTSLFTTQQVRRMQCWVQHLLKGWQSQSSSPPSPLALKLIPNPATHYLDVAFVTPTDGLATVEAFDLLGRRVATLLNQVLPPGSHHIRWNSEGTPSIKRPAGIYVMRVRAGRNEECGTFVWQP